MAERDVRNKKVKKGDIVKTTVEESAKQLAGRGLSKEGAGLLPGAELLISSGETFITGNISDNGEITIKIEESKE